MNKLAITLAGTVAAAGLVAGGTVVSRRNKTGNHGWDRVAHDAKSLSVKGIEHVKDAAGCWVPALAHEEPAAQEAVVSEETTEELETVPDAAAEEEPLTGEIEDDGSIVQIIIGDGSDGSVEPFSEWYNRVVEKQYELARNKTGAGILVVGSTYGLGTKGVEQEDGSFLFIGSDLNKLYKKVQVKKAAK